MKTNMTKERKELIGCFIAGGLVALRIFDWKPMDKFGNEINHLETEVIQEMQRGIPIVNSMINDFRNSFTGKKKVILIRSQNGTPLTTYAGDNVSLYKTSVPKSTGLLIDGKYLFVYRSDYTIYDLDLVGSE